MRHCLTTPGDGSLPKNAIVHEAMPGATVLLTDPALEPYVTFDVSVTLKLSPSPATMFTLTATSQVFTVPGAGSPPNAALLHPIGWPACSHLSSQRESAP